MTDVKLHITESQSGRSVGSLLRGELAMSRSYISRLKRRPAGILLNGKKAYTTAVVGRDDVLTVQICDPEDWQRAVPMACGLNIPWQDEYLAVIDKASGMAVHQSTRDPNELTLENAFSACFPEGENFHPVSRLDRGTTGLMIVAKSGYIHHRLKEILHTELFTREYIGIAEGKGLPAHGNIELPIGMADGSTYQRAISSDGVYAHTEYYKLEEFEKHTLLKLIPHTGRTHQLRLHMAAIGHPLAGDWLYGKRCEEIQRPALHSAELRLVHPMTGRDLHLCSELPEDMRRLIGR